MRYQEVFVLSLMAGLCSVPISAHAAAVIAGTIVQDVGPLAIGIQAFMILVAGLVVTSCAIGAFSNFERGDMGAAVFGVFKALVAAVLLFVMIPAIIDGRLAAASGLQ